MHPFDFFFFRGKGKPPQKMCTHFHDVSATCAILYTILYCKLWKRAMSVLRFMKCKSGRLALKCKSFLTHPYPGARLLRFSKVTSSHAFKQFPGTRPVMEERDAQNRPTWLFLNCPRADKTVSGTKQWRSQFLGLARGPMTVNKP